MDRVGVYARVSTADQKLQRQLNDLRDYVDREVPEAKLDTYADIVSGRSSNRGDEFDRLWATIEADTYDIIVVHELSRLSRRGAGAIHEFLEHCLEHETSVKDLDVGAGDPPRRRSR